MSNYLCHVILLRSSGNELRHVLNILHPVGCDRISVRNQLVDDVVIVLIVSRKNRLMMGDPVTEFSDRVNIVEDFLS